MFCIGVLAARRSGSGAALWLWRGVWAFAFGRFFSCAAFGFRRRERFGVAASTCGRNYRSAGGLTSTEQGAPPDRKKRHSIRLLTVSLVAPLFAAGELVVLLLARGTQGREML